MTTPRKVIENYWNIECERQVDPILDCYASDAELVVPGMGRLVGHDQIRAFYQDSIDRFPRLRVKIVGAIENGDRGAFEWQSVFNDHDGQEVPLKGINFVEVRDGKLQKVHVYFDSAELE